MNTMITNTNCCHFGIMNRGDDEPSISVDRLSLLSICIQAVDWQKFDSHPNTIIKNPVNHIERQIHGKPIRSITVNSSNYRLEIGVAVNQHGAINDYEKLEMNPAAILFETNLRNVNTAELLNQAILSVKQNLADEFGVTIDLSKATLRTIEINRNILLKQTFSNYNKVFNFIRTALPKTLQRVQSHEILNQSTGFRASNNERCLKFYDKERHVEIAIESGKILRVEYSFLQSRKIEAEFGFTSLAQLLDDFSVIDKAWLENFEADIIKRMPKILIAERKRHAEKLMSAIAAQPKGYIDKWLSATQSIFDVELLQESLKDVLKGQTSSRNINMRLQQLLVSAQDRQKAECEKIFGQMDLLREVLSKLKQ